LEPSGLKKQPANALKLSKLRALVLYSLRDTFLTMLGSSAEVDGGAIGADRWSLQD
jgi:hypothetical protein